MAANLTKHQKQRLRDAINNGYSNAAAAAYAKASYQTAKKQRERMAIGKHKLMTRGGDVRLTIKTREAFRIEAMRRGYTTYNPLISDLLNLVATDDLFNAILGDTFDANTNARKGAKQTATHTTNQGSTNP